MAGGEPRLGTTATYMRHNDHGTTRPSTEIDRLHDRTDNEYRIFSAGSVRKWSKFGLGRGAALRTGSSSPMSLGRSGLPDRPNDRSSEPSATYKDVRRKRLSTPEIFLIRRVVFDQHAAIDGQRHAGDHARRVPRQKQDRIGDVLRLAHTT